MPKYTPRLEVGTTVMIFQKPLSREDFEGMGLLHRFVRRDFGSDFEYWEVYFGTEGPYRRLVDPDAYANWLKQFTLNKLEL